MSRPKTIDHRPKTKDRRPKTKIIMVPGIIFLVVFSYGIALADETEDLRKRPVAEQEDTRGLRLKFREGPHRLFEQERPLVLLRGPAPLTSPRLKLGQPVYVRARDEVGTVLEFEFLNGIRRVVVWFDRHPHVGRFHAKWVKTTIPPDKAKRPRKRWTRQEIVAQIKTLRREGIDLSSGHIRRNRLDLFRSAVYHFESWQKAIEAAGLKYDQIRKHRRWSRAKIIKEIKRLHAQGADLSLTAMERRDQGLLFMAKDSHYFGSWRKAVKAAGIDYETISRHKRWSRRGIIKEIQRLSAQGADLSYDAIQRTHSPLLSAAQSPKYFGSWQKAIKAAGLDYDQIRKVKRWSRQSTIIAEIHRLKRLGANLDFTAVKRNSPALLWAAKSPSYFGSWQKAIEAAGLNYQEIQHKGKKLPRGNPHPPALPHQAQDLAPFTQVLFAL